MRTPFAALCAIALAATGCHDTVNTVENAQKVGQRNLVADQRVVTDAALNKHVSVFGVNTAMTPGGVLKVQVELINNSSSAQFFTYRFEWFDANGMIVNTLAAPVVAEKIEGRESKFITAVAPSPAVKDFRLKLIAGQ
jgi:uncharacterized protein YcfL